jgi:hypothetical protein
MDGDRRVFCLRAGFICGGFCVLTKHSELDCPLEVLVGIGMSKKTVSVLGALGVILFALLFFRNQRSTISEERTLSKLSSLSLDTATTSNTIDGVMISGARVKSSTYDPDDYLVITYRFNLDSQNLEPVQIQAFEDVGPTTSGGQMFFLRDQPEPLQLKEDGTDISSGTVLDINENPGKLLAEMRKGHVLSLITRVSSGSAKLRVTAPERGVIFEYIFSGNFFHPPISGLEEGEYTIEIEKVGESVSPITLLYQNNNGRPTKTLAREGWSFDASSKEFNYDCQKFVIELTKDELLTVSGNFGNANLAVYTSRGKWVGGRQDTGSADFLFEAPETDRYHLIYFQNIFAARQSSFRYGISGP